MKRENTDLRQQNLRYAQILNALSNCYEVSAILHGLQNQGDIESIAQMISCSRSSPAMKLSPTLNSLDKDTDVLSILRQKRCNVKHACDNSSQDLVDEDSAERALSKAQHASTQTVLPDQRFTLPRSIQELRKRACRGTTQLSDHHLIKHLFSIYWIWVHPSHAILNMDHFVRGYETGSEAYCSLYLIYAVCIAACDYLDPRWENVEGKSTDVARLRENLVAAARIEESSMDPDHNVKTTIKALAIMTLTGSGARGSSGETLG